MKFNLDFLKKDKPIELNLREAEVAEKELCKYISADDYYRSNYEINELFKKFPILEVLKNSPDVQDALASRVLNFSSEVNELLEKIPLGERGLIKVLSSKKFTRDVTDFIFEEFPYLKSFKTSPENQKDVEKGLTELFSVGHIQRAQMLLKHFPLPKEVVEESAKKGFINLLREGSIGSVEELLNTFPSLESFKNSPDAKEAAEKGLEKSFEILKYDRLKDFFRSFSFQKEFIQKMLEENILNKAEHVARDFFRELPFLKYFLKPSVEEEEKSKEEFKKAILEDKSNYIGYLNQLPFLESFKNSPEMIEAAKKNFIKKLSDGNYGHYYGAGKLLKHFPSLESFRNSPEAQEAAKAGFIVNLSVGYTSAAEELLKAFPHLESLKETPEIREAIKKGLIKTTLYNSPAMFQSLVEIFHVPEKVVEGARKEAFIEILSGGEISLVKGFFKTFPSLESFKNLPEVKDAVGKVFIRFLSEGDIYKSAEFHDFFPSLVSFKDSPEAEAAAEKGFIKILSNGYIHRAKELLGAYPSASFKDSPEAKAAAEEGFISMLSEGRVPEAKEILDLFPSLKSYISSKEGQDFLAERLSINFRRGDLDKSRELVDAFKINQNKIKEIYETKEFSLEGNIILQLQTQETLEPVLKKTVDIFGYASDELSFNMVKELLAGNIDEEVRSLGVTETGINGINQLDQNFKKFKKEIISEDFNPEILLKNKFTNRYFQNYTRFARAQFTGAGHTFDQVLQRYIDTAKQNQITPLNKNFTPSKIIDVATIEHSKNNTVKFSEQFLNRFSVLIEDIGKAKERLGTKNPLTSVADELEIVKQKELEILKARLATVPEKGKAPLEAKIEKLEQLNPRNIKEFQVIYEQLAQLKGTESLLRQALFAYAFAKNKLMLEKDITKIGSKNPSFDDISWVLNFIDHITNQETFAQYFKDKKASAVFEKTINTRAITEELSRFEDVNTGTTSFKFIPTRGILLELSGHMADACWADKSEKTIPLEKPNFSAVTMIQNPDNQHERVAGSCLLIETTSSSGEPLLVIRGLNPLEGVINQLKVSDFYEKYTEYLKDIAKKSGRKLAIVIDGHSGGAATNRPNLFTYLESLKEKLQPVTVPNAETFFNTYDITNKVFLVE